MGEFISSQKETKSKNWSPPGQKQPEKVYNSQIGPFLYLWKIFGILYAWDLIQ
jgi:hypothetical protein